MTNAKDGFLEDPPHSPTSQMERLASIMVSSVVVVCFVIILVWITTDVSSLSAQVSLFD